MPSSLPTPSPLDNPPSSYLKSAVRSQNRPISSTTTATHSTITPLPSDSLRNRVNAGRHAYAFHPRSTDAPQDHDTCDYDSDDHNVSRSETPSSTRRKLAWHSFFGIALTRRSSSTTSTPPQSTPSPERKGSTSTFASDPKTNSSRKRSFRFKSRPTTPKSVDDPSSPYSIPVPSSPLPLSASPRRRSFGLGTPQRTTPKSSTGHLPLPNVQTTQPGRSHARRLSAGSERPPHDSAVALPEERLVHKPGPDGGGRIKGKEREKLFVDPERPPHDVSPSFDFPSPSRNHLSPHLPRHPVFSNLPTVDSASSEENEQSSHRLHAIPRIIHTPPTPQRPGGDLDSPARPSASLPRVNAAKIEIAKAKPVATAHREQVLVSTSQSHPDTQPTASSKRRFTPRFLTGKDVPKSNDTDGQKSSRRPADGPVHKTASNIIGHARNMTSHRGKHGSFDFERPVSALNRSSSTVDRQKMHLPSLERTISKDSAARVAKSRLMAHQAESSQLKPDHTGDTSVISFSSVSLQTKSTGKDIGSNTPPGQSSSWGRASGRRILRTSHGTFAFEHPSSMPSTPNPIPFHLPSEPNPSDLPKHTPGVAQSQPSTPLHAIFDARIKHSRGQSCNTLDPVDSPGERKSKGKGRSLDLGLGLSWAPSRLREEVLMPGLILREKAKNRANGSDVTKMFESLLSESRFETFKKDVRRFDAHLIPLEGPSGLLARVEKLVAESGLSEPERNKLLSEFTVFVESHGG
ncbi:hypothetical protein OG21DRAFT_1512705 [Imleria badia]|nr:hypothetical protein OG21DRAFT_1512705 [Imleria badia]